MPQYNSFDNLNYIHFRIKYEVTAISIYIHNNVVPHSQNQPPPTSTKSFSLKSIFIYWPSSYHTSTSVETCQHLNICCCHCDFFIWLWHIFIWVRLLYFKPNLPKLLFIKRCIFYMPLGACEYDYAAVFVLLWRCIHEIWGIYIWTKIGVFWRFTRVTWCNLIEYSE